MEDRSWIYDGVKGDSLLYFKHVTQFVKAAKTHALRINKKGIWCHCKNYENNVLRSPANVMQGLEYSKSVCKWPFTFVNGDI
jgi:hypothetical protein